MNSAAHPARKIADAAMACRDPAAGAAKKTARVPSRGSTIPDRPGAASAFTDEARRWGSALGLNESVTRNDKPYRMSGKENV
jgi:hypothetical protein